MEDIIRTAHWTTDPHQSQPSFHTRQCLSTMNSPIPISRRSLASTLCIVNRRHLLQRRPVVMVFLAKYPRVRVAVLWPNGQMDLHSVQGLQSLLCFLSAITPSPGLMSSITTSSTTRPHVIIDFNHILQAPRSTLGLRRTIGSSVLGISISRIWFWLGRQWNEEGSAFPFRDLWPSSNGKS